MKKSAYPQLDKLIDRCPEFKRALDDYQAVYATGDAEAAATAWERVMAAAQAFWARQKNGRRVA